MVRSGELEMYIACERLVYRFLRLLESEQSKTADLFAEDGQAFELIGREAIREHFASIEAVDDNVNVNLCSNLVIEFDDVDHARVTNYVTHYVAERLAENLTDPTGAQIGGELNTARSITRWAWELKRVNGEWLIAKLQYPDSVLLRKDVIEAL